MPPDHEKEAGGESSKGLFLERMIQVANTPRRGEGTATIIKVRVALYELAHWKARERLALNVLEILKCMPSERRQYILLRLAQHLYDAQEWPRLFEMLDLHQYGRAKLRYDPGTFSYAQDLTLGQQAATWSGWTLEEGIALLPRLWQYTLLQSNLATRADGYPERGFRLLALLKREQEALGLVELLTNLSREAQML